MCAPVALVSMSNLNNLRENATRQRRDIHCAVVGWCRAYRVTRADELIHID